jgi:hypothetical protein
MDVEDYDPTTPAASFQDIMLTAAEASAHKAANIII